MCDLPRPEPAPSPPKLQPPSPVRDFPQLSVKPKSMPSEDPDVKRQRLMREEGLKLIQLIRVSPPLSYHISGIWKFFFFCFVFFMLTFLYVMLSLFLACCRFYKKCIFCYMLRVQTEVGKWNYDYFTLFLFHFGQFCTVHCVFSFYKTKSENLSREK